MRTKQSFRNQLFFGKQHENNLNPSNYPYTLDRFFEHIREAVLYFPDSPTLNVQTFSVVEALDEINKANIGNDWRSAKTRYCLSKRFEKRAVPQFEFDFPAVLANELDYNVASVLGDPEKSVKINHNVKLYILDVLKSNKEITDSNQDRTPNEIFRDTKTILLYILAYFKKIRFVKITNTDTSITYGYYHLDVLDKMVDDAEITSYSNTVGDLVKVNSWFNSMLMLNDNLQISLYNDIGQAGLCGVSIELQIGSALCINPTWNLDFESRDMTHGG